MASRLLVARNAIGPRLRGHGGSSIARSAPIAAAIDGRATQHRWRPSLVRGHIEIRGRCIVAVGPTGQTSLPIFDATVSLNDTSDGIVDARSGVHISIGQQFRAGAATFRDNGKGWSLADIKQATGVSVPNGCGSTIVMLRDIEAGPEPARRTDTAR